MKDYRFLCQQTLFMPLGATTPHLLVVGESGSGKTTTIMLPLMAAAIRSNATTVIINTKGRRFTRILARLAKLCGRTLTVLAFKDPARSVGWTGLGGVRTPGEAREVAFTLTQAAETREATQDSVFFIAAATEWLQNAIAALADGHPAQERNLTYLRQIISAGAFAEFAARHPRFPALRKFANFKETGSQNAATVEADLGMRTAYLDDERVRAVLAHDELDLERFARVGGLLVVEIDEQDVDDLKPLMTLLIRRLLSALLAVAAKSPTGRLPHRFFLFINEFAANGRIPGIESFLHTSRERGVSIVADTQSIAQFTLYGAQADTVLAGFQSQVALAGLDPASAEYFSRKAGVMTVKNLTLNEDWDDELNQPRLVGRSVSYAPRAVLTATEIARPKRHPLLGRPATFFLGGGVPPFQAYLTPAYELGGLARVLDEADTDPTDEMRAAPLEYVERPLTGTTARLKTDTGLPPGITDTRGWTDARLRKELEKVRAALDWDQTTGSARRWWEAFENESQQRLALALRLAEELRNRRATITEFFLAYVYSNTDNIQANLCYLDYTRLKKEEERKKRAARPQPPFAKPDEAADDASEPD